MSPKSSLTRTTWNNTQWKAVANSVNKYTRACDPGMKVTLSNSFLKSLSQRPVGCSGVLIPDAAVFMGLVLVAADLSASQDSLGSHELAMSGLMQQTMAPGRWLRANEVAAFVALHGCETAADRRGVPPGHQLQGLCVLMDSRKPAAFTMTSSQGAAVSRVPKCTQSVQSEATDTHLKGGRRSPRHARGPC